MSLRERLWATMAPTYAAILNHPFLAGLTDGTLDRDRFAYYVTQDAIYLGDYARALAVVGAKAPEPRQVATFARHAAGAVDVERALHDTLLAELGLDPSEVASAEPAPTTRAYSSYLMATAYGGSFADGVAAVLPCYWVYAEVGRALVEQGSPDPRYQRWIETYAGEEFAVVVAEVLAVVDRLAEVTSPATEERMHAAAAVATRYEYAFWDAAWNREDWPLPLRG